MIKLNGIEIKPTIFPDGTSQVWKFGHGISDHIELDFENESEIISLFQLLDFYRVKKIQHPSLYVSIDMPFLPYGRQDKSTKDSDNTFGLNTFMRILESFGPNLIDGITTLDAHNKSALSGMFINKEPIKEIRNAMMATNPSLLCFPDKGAQDRYTRMSMLEDFPNCSFSKDRDQETGHIKNLFLNELIGLEGENVLIIDDITDGGMTFILTAKKLLECGAKSVHLYTTHGIYSKGTGVLFDSGISRIFNRKGEVLNED